MRKEIVFFLLISLIPATYAQQNVFVKKWDKRYGGVSSDICGWVLLDNHGGYLLGGGAASGIGGDKSENNWDTTYNYEDAWIIKTDSIGNKIWDKRYGGVLQDFSMQARNTADGGNIIGCQSYSNADGNKTESCRGGFCKHPLFRIGLKLTSAG